MAMRACSGFTSPLICLLAVTSVNGWCGNHLILFGTTQNLTNESRITWETSSNIQARCEQESRRRGFDGFKKNIEACSFWGKQGTADVCLIITKEKTNIDTLGHEMRHCFQGNFHK